MMESRVASLFIDVSSITNSRELHKLLKDQLEFPDFYGNNWDAFWDAITGLVELPLQLTFVGWECLKKKLPDDARILRKQLCTLNEQFANVGYVCDVRYE